MNSITESCKRNPMQLSHVIPVDLQNLSTVPDSHAWNEPSAHQPINPLTQEPVPVINLADPQASGLIRDACEKWGVFQLTNHGICKTLLHEVEHQTRRLFEMPAKSKLLAVRSPESSSGYGLPRISAFFPKMMWSEGFSIVGSPVQLASQLWPHDYASFCNAMEEYQKVMKQLSEKIIKLMIGSVGLTPEDVECFMPEAQGEAQALLQLNSYPVCPDPGRAMGLGPHTDSSLLTLLYQCNVGGLQVFQDSVGWLPVHPVSDAITVNVGDLLHIVSNGLFKSSTHRVTAHKTHHRVSVAYFYGPPKNVKISPSFKLTDSDHPPLYHSVTWEEYLDAKATHFDKALDLIRRHPHPGGQHTNKI